jgi:hypothetical protein
MNLIQYNKMNMDIFEFACANSSQNSENYIFWIHIIVLFTIFNSKNKSTQKSDRVLLTYSNFRCFFASEIVSKRSFRFFDAYRQP